MKKLMCEEMDVLINYTSKMLSHYVSISNHHDLHLKYPTISCQLCLSKAEI